LKDGTHSVQVKVSDPTGFVRDPAIRATPALTQTRTWTVDTNLTTPPADVPADFTSSTPTDKPVGGESVVYVETTHPTHDVPAVRWEIDGRRVKGGDRDIDRGRLRLRKRAHQLVARVGSTSASGTHDA